VQVFAQQIAELVRFALWGTKMLRIFTPVSKAMSPLRGNIGQDQKRAAASKFWVSDNFEDIKRIQTDAQCSLLILAVSVVLKRRKNETGTCHSCNSNCFFNGLLRSE
jgi:hypothetical protein